MIMEKRLGSRLLRINLTTGKIFIEQIPIEDRKLYLGGRVLGAKYLYEELDALTDPLSADNKIFISVGPLTATTAPSTGRYIIQTKSPQTGLYLCSVSGGHFGPELRRAGWDMVIIEGASDSPVYLSIQDDKVEIRGAGHLWGMSTEATQEFIKDDLKDSAVRIACIGPAGEKLVSYACVVNERRTAGRGGAGAVMGSKNLKAIAIRGKQRVDIARPDAFKKAVRHIYEDIEAQSMVRESFRMYGTHSAFSALFAGGIIPWRNWQDGSFPNADALFPETWREKFVKKDMKCAAPCTFDCSKLTLAPEGPHAGVVSDGPDYETVYSLGASCGITDFPAIIEADALCDALGLDTISMGLCISFAMECFEKGIIDEVVTDGMELRFGKSQLLRKLIHDTAYREGFGKILAEGSRKMSERFGNGSEAFAMQVKGLEMGGYDPRGAKSLALIYACGPRGGCQKANGGANGQARMELQSGDVRFSNEGKSLITKKFGDRKMITDSLIFCTFVHGAISDEATLEAVNAVTGFDYQPEEFSLISGRGSNLERMFNVREGLRRNWDKLPDRLLKEKPKSGANRDQVVDLVPLIDDYYQICGWDRKTGIPTEEKLRELGLEWVL
jgi:aldehyde:ferredoxin oxidoreductase